MRNPKFWICVLTKVNFELVKQEKIYGVPDNKRSLEQIKQIKTGDILLFYIVSPFKSIMGVSSAISEVFEDRKGKPWNDRSYPHRIRITNVETINVPLKAIRGKIESMGYAIPMGTSLLQITKRDFLTIKTLVNSEINTKPC